MRFKTYIPAVIRHSDFVVCISWTTNEEVVSFGDDHQMFSWNAITHEATKIADLPSDLYPTDCHSYPKSVNVGRQKQVVSDVFVIGASDGKYHIINRNGRIEKSVEAHQGAVLGVRWSNDGSALATAGEDGLVKIWSKNCMLRTTLAASSVSTYSLSWSPQSDQIIYTFDNRLVIKPISPNSKPIEWKAHESIVLKVAWNHNNNMIVSGSEDCRYKVWDSLGRLLFSSAQHDYPITSLAWSPDGSLFAIGSFNTLKLCDQAGWSYSLDKPQIQSIFALAWSSDSTQIAGACANGNIIFAHVINKRVEWKSFEVTVVGRKNIAIKNVAISSTDELDFRDNVIKVSLQFGHLIAITTSQCYIYKTTNWMTPHSFDLKESNVALLVPCDKHFLLVDGSNVTLYSYEGRLLLNVKWIGMRIEALNKYTISLSADVIAVRDANDAKQILFIDTQSGKLMADATFKHKVDIVSVTLNYCGLAGERLCAFIDKNGDLYLNLVRASNLVMFRTIKLSAMAKCAMWNDEANVICAIQENNKLIVWLYPAVAFVDNDLINQAVIEKDASEFGTKNPQLINFVNNNINIRRFDGALLPTSINPFVTLLHSYASQTQWEEALKLCRFLKDNHDSRALWSALAGMALSARQLDVAEMAYAAIDKVDKVFYIQKIKESEHKEVRNAEIALISGNVREAENIFIQSGFILRAILLNLELYKWDRAYEIAVKYEGGNKFREVVNAYRQRYLDRFGKKETMKQYRELSNEIENIDWQAFEERIKKPYAERVSHQSKQSSKR